MNGFHDFNSGVPGLRNFFRRNSPDFLSVSARFEVVDRTLARKLIAFLAVFTPALAVALPGNHRAARAFASDVAGRKAQVDQRQAVFDARPGTATVSPW